MNWIIGVIIGCILLGAACMYLLLRRKLRWTENYNYDIREQNQAMERRNIELDQERRDLLYECEHLRYRQDDLRTALGNLQQTYQTMQKSAEDAADAIYESSLAVAQERLAEAAEKEREKYLSLVESYKNELQTTMEEGAAAYVNNLAAKEQKCKELAQKYDELLADTNAAIAAAKRAEEIKQSANFYKLNLSDLDIDEIRMLKNVAPYLRDKEPLNKVIWKVYYEKPTTDLIGRVIGSGVHTGIYKITNLENQMCYVGQAANLADRWKQHIKRGLGAETPTKNKLYPAMITFGVENFSFEVIEECAREKLDEREDYWQEYFKAKEFGYSIK